MKLSKKLNFHQVTPDYSDLDWYAFTLHLLAFIPRNLARRDSFEKKPTEIGRIV